MSENYSEEIGIFTIECRKLIDNSWKIGLKSSGLLALIVRFDEKEEALIFFDTKCEELRNLLRNWNDFGQETGFLGDDLLDSI
jgi:hypothetical protein